MIALWVYGLNVALVVTAICLMGLVAARCLLRNNPTLRYWFCLIGLIAILLSPFAIALQSRLGNGLLTVSLPLPMSATSATRTEMVASNQRYAPTLRPGGISPKIVAVVSEGLFLLWGLGVVWGLARFVHGLGKISRLIRGSRAWNPSEHLDQVDRLERLLGRPLPPVFIAPQIASPVVVGVLRPSILLPEGLPEALAPAPLRQVLLHEGAHVACQHTWSGIAERIVGLLFWPHPLVAALRREMAWAREEVCDNVALQEAGAACYARTLLALAQGISTAPHVQFTLAFLGPETSLEARIAGLLDPRRNRYLPMKRWKFYAATAFAICLMGSTAAVRVVAAQEPKASSENKTARLLEVKVVEGKLAAEKAQAEIGNVLFFFDLGPILVSTDDGQPYLFYTVGDSVSQVHFTFTPATDSLQEVRLDGHSAPEAEVIRQKRAAEAARLERDNVVAMKLRLEKQRAEAEQLLR